MAFVCANCGKKYNTLEELQNCCSRGDLSECPKTFQKIPVKVQAMKYNGNNYYELSQFLGFLPRISLNDKKCLLIPTLEGTIEAKPGHYIVKGVNGEFYPVRSDIFFETYEEVPHLHGNRGKI